MIFNLCGVSFSQFTERKKFSNFVGLLGFLRIYHFTLYTKQVVHNQVIWIYLASFFCISFGKNTCCGLLYGRNKVHVDLLGDLRIFNFHLQKPLIDFKLQIIFRQSVICALRSLFWIVLKLLVSLNSSFKQIWHILGQLLIRFTDWNHKNLRNLCLIIRYTFT